MAFGKVDHKPNNSTALSNVPHMRWDMNPFSEAFITLIFILF